MEWPRPCNLVLGLCGLHRLPVADHEAQARCSRGSGHDAGAGWLHDFGIIPSRDPDGRLMATTEELQREEDYIVGQAAGGRGSVAPVGVADGLTRTMKGGKPLNDGQWE